jgi:hypothetical protein
MCHAASHPICTCRLLVSALCPALQDIAAAQAAEQVALLEEWVDLLKARDEVDAAAARAQASGGSDALLLVDAIDVAAFVAGLADTAAG